MRLSQRMPHRGAGLSNRQSDAGAACHLLVDHHRRRFRALIRTGVTSPSTTLSSLPSVSPSALLRSSPLPLHTPLIPSPPLPSTPFHTPPLLPPATLLNKMTARTASPPLPLSLSPLAPYLAPSRSPPLPLSYAVPSSLPSRAHSHPRSSGLLRRCGRLHLGPRVSSARARLLGWTQTIPRRFLPAGRPRSLPPPAGPPASPLRAQAVVRRLLPAGMIFATCSLVG